MPLKVLKWTQLGVAIATTLALGAGLLWPGAMAYLVLPLGFLYVLWAIRAMLDRRVSIWLACALTLVVALSLGAVGITQATFALRAAESGRGMAPRVAFDPAGNAIALPPDAVAVIRAQQSSMELQRRIHTVILVLIGLGAWTVLALYVLEWRWALSGKHHDQA